MPTLTAPAPTADRILAAALAMFGTRGYEATSLDAIAADLGLRKQTILYWFASKEALLDAVVEHSAVALRDALDAALAGAPAGADRIELVMRTVFRFAVRRPALLGVVREVNRLGPAVAGTLAERIRPLVERSVAFLGAEMDAGTIRRADPRLLLLFMYATVVGVATEVEAQQAVGLTPSPASLRRLRRELFAYVRAAVAAPAHASLPAMVPADRSAEPSAPSVV
jgi:TetR/AcrR family transcriptional regulator